MKKLKKLTAVLTAAAILAGGNIGVLPERMTDLVVAGVSASYEDIIASGECGAEGDNLTWTFDSEGTLTISGEGEMSDWTYSSKHPWHSYKDNIVNVTIEKGVTSIGDYAFYSCYNLSSVTIPDSVTSIGYDAFYSCRVLTGINVDSENKYYSSEDGVLFDEDKSMLIHYPAGKTAEVYVIPDGVTIIGDSAFYWCDNLTSVKLPDSVTSIRDYAFGVCFSLTSVTIPDSVTNIESFAFINCINLESIIIEKPECEIYDSESTINHTATIYGYKNSTAQSYAEKYGREFIALDAGQNTTLITTTQPITTTTSKTTTTTTSKATTTTTMSSHYIYNGHTYKVFDIGCSWTEAEEQCESMGGYLVSINTADEQDFIEYVLSEQLKDNYWTGGYLLGNIWYWSDGSKVSYTNWDSWIDDDGEVNEQPDNWTGDEYYIRIASHYKKYDGWLVNAGKWIDTANTADGISSGEAGLQTFGFICEWDTTTGTTTTTTKITTTTTTTKTTTTSTTTSTATGTTTTTINNDYNEIITTGKSVAEWLNSGFNKFNVTVYDGTEKNKSFNMMGNTFTQGLLFDDEGSPFYGTLSFNVENIDSITFTLGHIDNMVGKDEYLDIYIDNELAHRIFCDDTMNNTKYKFDTSRASSVRFYLEDINNYTNVYSYFGLANIVLNDDYSTVPDGAYSDPSKINDLDVFYKPTENNNELQIDSSASFYNNHFYKAIYDPTIKTWKDAQAYCEALGGYLATISDAQEQDFVLGLIEKNEDADCYWLGGYYTRATDEWAWVDGTEFSYTNWAQGSPDFYENSEYCLEIAARDYEEGDWKLPKGTWNDDKNETSVIDGFVCEWAGQPKFNLGDVTLDGIINGSDATITLNAYTIISSGSPSPLNDVQTKAADVDKDGIITGSDATLILRYYTIISSMVSVGNTPSLEEWLINQ